MSIGLQLESFLKSINGNLNEKWVIYVQYFTNVLNNLNTHKSDI